MCLILTTKPKGIIESNTYLHQEAMNEKDFFETNESAEGYLLCLVCINKCIFLLEHSKNKQ